MPDHIATLSAPGAHSRPSERAGRTLVAGKLTVPSTVPTLVGRPRLLAMLDRGVHRRLTLVTGPAGAGKTALLASWLSGGTRFARAGWLSLDKLDNEPTRLRTYLTAAVRQATSSPPAPPTSRSDTQLLNDLASVLDRSAVPVILVLDDVQCLLGGPVTRLLASLLRQPLPGLHLVLSTRSRPTLPLERLHLVGELAEIDADDLALTAAEAAQVWAAYGGSTADGQVAAVIEQTEGLVAGVCLAAIATAERRRLGAARVRTAKESLADFFRAEVLSHHPREVRELLLRSSVVDEISAELVTTLTGRPDAPQLLDRMRLEDQLVGPAGADPTRFRYRRPFREFLHDEARLTIPDELPNLHLRAARWYDDHHEPLAALRHAAAAGDWGYAAALVVREVAPQLLGPGRQLLCELPSRLPAPQARRVPEIAATFALVAAAQGDAHGTNSYGALVRPHLADLPAERAWPLRASLLLGAVVLAWHREDAAAVLDGPGTELVSVLDAAPAGLVPAAASLRAIAQVAIGTAWLWSGKLEEAAATLPAAVAEAQKQHLDLAAADGLGSLAFLHAVRGQLTSAVEQAEAAVRLAEPRCAQLVLGHLALGIACWLRGDHPQAHRCLADAAGGELRPSGSLALAALQGRVKISEGDVRGAREVLDEARRAIGDWRPPPLLRHWLAIAQAELNLAEARPVQALTEVTDAMREPASPVGCQARVVAARAYLANAAPARAASLLGAVHEYPGAGSWVQVEAWLTEALAADELDHRGTVTIALSKAVSAAAPELLEPFLAAGEPLARLLRRHHDVVAIRGRFVDRLLTALHERAGEPARSEEPLPEPITPREDVVLQFLPTLLTTDDIAAELSVSPNTVKTHLRNIYRKLSASTRRDAVHRARTAGLLHP